MAAKMINGHQVVVMGGRVSCGFFRASAMVDGVSVQVFSSARENADRVWREDGMEITLSHPRVVAMLAK